MSAGVLQASSKIIVPFPVSFHRRADATCKIIETAKEIKSRMEIMGIVRTQFQHSRIYPGTVSHYIAEQNFFSSVSAV
jgi:hypothetical protein